MAPRIILYSYAGRTHIHPLDISNAVPRDPALSGLASAASPRSPGRHGIIKGVVMSNWVENRIELVGSPKDVRLFRRSYDGIGCCGWTLCVHRLAERLIPPGSDRNWATGIRIADEDEFDSETNVYNLFIARESMIPLFARISGEVLDLGFKVRSCDLCSGCGYIYHAFEASFERGKATNMKHEYWTVAEKPEDSERVEKDIWELDRLLLAMQDPNEYIRKIEPEPCRLDTEF